MAYWAASVLAALVPKVGGAVAVTGSSPVDLNGFQTIIDEISAEFDQSAAKAGYAVPIATTASAGYLVAQRIVRAGAVADLLRTIYTGPDGGKHADRFQAAFDNALKAVAAGNTPIPGAAQGNVTGLYPVWSGVPSPTITPTMGGTLSGIPNDF